MEAADHEFAGPGTAPVAPQPRTFTSVFLQPGATGRQLWRQHLQGCIGIAFSVWMVGMLLRMAYKHDVVWFGFGSGALAAGVGWLVASIQFSARPAQLHFQGNSFFYSNLRQWAASDAVEPFPLSYANPVAAENTLTLHFHDRVLVLKAQHWAEFSDIRQRFIQH